VATGGLQPSPRRTSAGQAEAVRRARVPGKRLGGTQRYRRNRAGTDRPGRYALRPECKCQAKSWLLLSVRGGEERPTCPVDFVQSERSLLKRPVDSEPTSRRPATRSACVKGPVGQRKTPVGELVLPPGEELAENAWEASPPYGSQSEGSRGYPLHYWKAESLRQGRGQGARARLSPASFFLETPETA